MTSLWYREVFSRVPAEARILDVGIGTGTSLCRNASLVKEKKLSVTAVDIDAAYVRFCQAQLVSSGLGDSCSAVCKSIFDSDLAEAVGRDFNVVYFSGSIALMPEPHRALQIAAKLLKPGGCVYVTQTFQRKTFPGLSLIKPLLYYLTTIDFGQLTFEKDVVSIVERSGLKLVEKSLIAGSVDNAWQAAFILVAKMP